MMKLYGIPTCSTVRKARKFFKENGIEIEFIDFKKTNVGCDELEYWLKEIELEALFNNRGTTYRTLKLKDMNLNDDEKKEWLCKENLLIKRPVIEFEGKLIVGFNEDNFNGVFL